MIYKVFVHELIWHNFVYEVEAESKDEAREAILDGEGDLVSDDYDYCEQRNIDSIYLYEN